MDLSTKYASGTMRRVECILQQASADIKIYISAGAKLQAPRLLGPRRVHAGHMLAFLKLSGSSQAQLQHLKVK